MRRIWRACSSVIKPVLAAVAWTLGLTHVPPSRTAKPKRDGETPARKSEREQP